ncbi:MAG TPA: hypothetical protein VFH06_01170 [Candidatus Saccharimonadales bacterium]|nr:hypothetical protein [Candidatus Saccharimonadales bacterium]
MFMWRDLFSNIRRRVLVLAAVPLLSLLSLYTPFFANSAYAVTADDVLNRARAWSILQAVIDKASLLDSSISNEDASNCHIFGGSDNDAVYVGHWATGDNDDNGTVYSNGGSWDALENRVDLANNALASVGIQGGCRGLLEKLGYTSSGGDMNQPKDYSNGDGEVRDKLQAALKADAFFGRRLSDGSPGDAISYAMLYYALTNVCGWAYRNPFVPNDTSPGDDGSRNREAQNNGWSGDSRNSHFHTYTYENGKAGENTYYKGGGREDDIRVGSKTGFANSGNNDAITDCGDNNADTIGAKLGDNPRFADAYAALLKPGGQYTPGTCGEKYPAAGTDAEVQRANALRAACDDGFKNKTAGYCDKYNSDKGLKDACLYGQQTATGLSTDTTPAQEKDPTKKEDKTTCAIPGIGWIVCPILNLLAQLVDGAYSFVAALLKVQPVVMDTNSGLFKAWSVMRNFANIAFVIAFLFIIFSQVTSFGISNYGIKRMLPRLIIAAILVNVSFWICSLAVDLSNIGGASLKSLFDGIGQGLSLPNTDNGFNSGTQWQGIVGGLLGGTVLVGAALYIGLSALIPVILACLIAILAVFLVLVIRQALIVLLIVISPLAFVAYLLPNTESLFTRWRKLFTTLLILYPVVSIIFGASALASKIVMGGS